jgi:hypothetical protein
LSTLVRRHPRKKRSGQFVLPEAEVKLKRAQGSATKARKGRNPLTDEEMLSATVKVRVVSLKALKELLRSD